MEITSDPFQALMDGMPETAVVALMSLLVMRLVPAGRNLFEEQPDSLVLLYSGSVTQYLSCVGKSLIEIARHGPGSVLGLARVLQAQPCIAQAMTCGECSVGFIPGNKFRDFLHQYPKAYLPVSRILSKEVQNAIGLWKKGQRLALAPDALVNLSPYPTAP